MRNEYIKIFLKHILTYSFLDVYLWFYGIGYDKTLKGGNDTLRDMDYCFVLCCLGFLFCYTVRDFVVGWRLGFFVIVCVLVGG